jgi:hypothetical protein
LFPEVATQSAHAGALQLEVDTKEGRRVFTRLHNGLIRLAHDKQRSVRLY